MPFDPILVVLPLLAFLMFGVGLALNWRDFYRLWQAPRAVLVGLCAQIFLLPAVAIFLGWAFSLPPVFFMGLFLIACSPGGVSSNVFTLIAGGDLPLSVTLTAISSLLTVFTIPLFVALFSPFVQEGGAISLFFMGKLFLQNVLLMLFPLLLGFFYQRRFIKSAAWLQQKISKIAFPALLCIASLFFLQHFSSIAHYLPQLGLCILFLILFVAAGSYALCRFFLLNRVAQKTILIETVMQNAAQGIALASSPFLFNNALMAIPSILYALLMNIALLIYLIAQRQIRICPQEK